VAPTPPHPAAATPTRRHPDPPPPRRATGSEQTATPLIQKVVDAPPPSLAPTFPPEILRATRLIRVAKIAPIAAPSIGKEGYSRPHSAGGPCSARPCMPPF
jgi:hypothetical protein